MSYELNFQHNKLSIYSQELIVVNRNARGNFFERKKEGYISGQGAFAFNWIWPWYWELYYCLSPVLSKNCSTYNERWFSKNLQLLSLQLPYFLHGMSVLFHGQFSSDENWMLKLSHCHHLNSKIKDEAIHRISYERLFTLDANKFNIDSNNSNINTFCSVFPTNLSPFHHVTIAGGRDPNVLHSNQYGLSAENGSCLVMMATFSGRTKITCFYYYLLHDF